jgi:hypothetical protein
MKCPECHFNNPSDSKFENKGVASRLPHYKFLTDLCSAALFDFYFFGILPESMDIAVAYGIDCSWLVGFKAQNSLMMGVNRARVWSFC